jgi:glucose-1-phosphate thymidylyltransferase
VTHHYLKTGQLTVEVLGEGFVWLDAGTPDALAQATAIVQGFETRQAIKLGCVEEVAYRMGFISAEDLQRLSLRLGSSAYGRYLSTLANGPG